MSKRDPRIARVKRDAARRAVLDERNRIVRWIEDVRLMLPQVDAIRSPISAGWREALRRFEEVVTCHETACELEPKGRKP